MKKYKLIFILSIFIAVIFYAFQAKKMDFDKLDKIDKKIVYFEKIDKKIETLKEDKYSYSIQNYDKPIKTINLINEKGIVIFTTKEHNYPKIYGFNDKFIVNFYDDVVVFDEKKIIDSIVNRNYGYNKVAIYKEKAYIFLNNRFFIYDKNGFKKIPFKFDFSFVDEIFVDKNNIYINVSPKGDDELLVLNQNLKDYTFYKDYTYDKFGLVPIHYAKDGYIYFRDDNLTLKAISLNNKVKSITKKRYFARFKNFYIIKNKDSFSLYSFPKNLLTTFKTNLKFDRFFILKNYIYLKEIDTIKAKLNLKTNKLTLLKPTKISYRFDVNKNYIAFVKDNMIKILDENLNILKQYKINLLSNVYQNIKKLKSSIKIEKLFDFITIVDFGDKKINILALNGFFESYVLKDYAIFRAFSEKDRVLVVGKNNIFKLKLASKHNKIYRLKPLKNNRFVVVDGFGERVVDIEKIVLILIRI